MLTVPKLSHVQHLLWRELYVLIAYASVTDFNLLEIEDNKEGQQLPINYSNAESFKYTMTLNYTKQPKAPSCSRTTTEPRSIVAYASMGATDLAMPRKLIMPLVLRPI